MKKLPCPECGKLNEPVRVPDGFYFCTIEYRCNCGYVLIMSDYTYTITETKMRKELETK